MGSRPRAPRAGRQASAPLRGACSRALYSRELCVHALAPSPRASVALRRLSRARRQKPPPCAVPARHGTCTGQGPKRPSEATADDVTRGGVGPPLRSLATLPTGDGFVALTAAARTATTTCTGSDVVGCLGAVTQFGRFSASVSQNTDECLPLALRFLSVAHASRQPHQPCTAKLKGVHSVVPPEQLDVVDPAGLLPCDFCTNSRKIFHMQVSLETSSQLRTLPGRMPVLAAYDAVIATESAVNAQLQLRKCSLLGYSYMIQNPVRAWVGATVVGT
eukprot:scaffold389_cov382-Prasinococcus_capsulatus_cf.AAC.11